MSELRAQIEHINEVLGECGLVRGATVASVQRRLRVNAADAMRLLSIREAVSAALLSRAAVPSDVAAYLKEGETVVECVERNRRDIDALMTLLAREKRTVESIATMLGWENVPPQDTLEAEIRALKARARAPVPVTPEKEEWQPMSTAPKDGRGILVAFRNIGTFQVFWSEEPFGKGIGAWCVTDNKNEDKPLRGYREDDELGWKPVPVAHASAGPTPETK